MERHKIQDIYDLLLATPGGLTTCQIAEILDLPVKKTAHTLFDSARKMRIGKTRSEIPESGGTVNLWRAIADTSKPCRCWTCPTQRERAA